MKKQSSAELAREKILITLGETEEDLRHKKKRRQEKKLKAKFHKSKQKSRDSKYCTFEIKRNIRISMQEREIVKNEI